MATPAPSTSHVCSRFHRAIELIGSRWTGAILQTLLQGKTRYAAIRGAIPDITDRMLSERLRSLESEGLLTRGVIPDTPVRVEYDLTEKGRELQDALREISTWAERWIHAAGGREGYAELLGKSRVENLGVKEHAYAAATDYGY